MDGATFASDVAALALGKRTPDGVYVHVEALPHLPAALRSAVDAARALALLGPGAFDVVKLGVRGHKLSLLAYPGNFEEGFPVLAASWAVDLAAGTVAHRAYAAEGNPPILHRKETMLPPQHPRLAELRALTAEAERLGLFTETRAIGTLRPWAARLARLGVRVEGHRLVETPRADGEGAGAGAVVEEGQAGQGEAVPAVQRHRTALQRYSLSTPMAALLRHGSLDGRGTRGWGPPAAGCAPSAESEGRAAQFPGRRAAACLSRPREGAQTVRTRKNGRDVAWPTL
jgi:hypothetical protein